MQNPAPPRAATRLIPVKKWPEFHPWPTLGGLRHLLHGRDSNGFNACVVRVGRSVLIDEAAFFEWVDTKRERP